VKTQPTTTSGGSSILFFFYLIAQSSGTFDLELPREVGIVDREASG
jgi:hypothetical protein